MTKNEIKESLSLLESYLLDLEVDVYYGASRTNAYYYEDQCIEINSKQDFESRLYSLLHEAGHVHIRRDNFKDRFPFMKPRKISKNGELRGNIKHRTDIIREEVLAWEEAQQIASMLSINVDPSRWANQRSKYLISYLKWTS